MKKLFTLTIFFFTVLFTAHLYSQNTYALIIGVSKYQHPNIKHLKYADRDALAFKRMLTSRSGGNVRQENIKCFINDSATSTNILASLRWVENVPKSGERMIIYFSGHGDAIDPEQVYLLTYDANASDPNLYDNSAISMYKLKNLVKRLRIKGVEVVLITDACRTNEEADNSTAGIYSFESIMNKDNGEIKMNSCSQNQKSMEDPRWGNGHGVFTYYLLQGWMGMANENEDNEITVGELFRYVTKKVKDATYDVVLKKTMQVPSSCCSQHEDVVLATIDSETLKKLKEIEEQTVVTDDVFAYATSKSGYNAYDEDTATMRVYNELVGAIADDKILLPKGSSAYDYYLTLKQIAAGKPIFYDGESELLAALNSKGQEVVGNYLNGSIENINSAVFKNAYDYMNVGLHILSKEDLYYTNFKTKALFLESQYLMFRLSTRNQALAKIDSAISIQPNSAYLSYSKGLIYVKYLNYDSAMVSFNKAISLAPKWAAPYQQKATLLNGLGKTGEAITCMTMLLKNSDRASNQMVLGNFYLGIDSFELAVSCYNLSLAKDSSLVSSYTGLSTCYRYLLNDSLSSYYMDMAGKVSENDIDFYPNYASYYEKIGKYQDAADKYFALYERDTTRLYYYVKYAEMLYRGDDKSAAVKIFSNIMELDPYFLKTYYVIIDLVEDDKEYQSSITFNKFLLDYDPAYNPSQMYFPFYKLGMPDSAEFYLEMGERKFPNELLTLEYRAYDQMQNGKYEDAIKSYETLVTRKLNTTTIFTNLAYCYDKVSNGTKCIENMRNALAMDKFDLSKYKLIVQYLWDYKYPHETILEYVVYPIDNDFGLLSENYFHFATYQLTYLEDTVKLKEFCDYGSQMHSKDYRYPFYTAIYYLKVGNAKGFYSSFEEAMKMGGITCDLLKEYSFILPDPGKDKKYLKMSKKICK